MKMIAKCFSSSSAGVLLEKVIRKNLGMFRHKMSTRKSFFSKTMCSSSKKEFRHILFPWKFRKMPRKKKTHKNFEKDWQGLFLVSMNISANTFYNLIKLTCRSLSKQSFSKCSEQINAESSGRYFSFLSMFDMTKPFLSNFFSFIFWDLMKT